MAKIGAFAGGVTWEVGAGAVRGSAEGNVEEDRAAWSARVHWGSTDGAGPFEETSRASGGEGCDRDASPRAGASMAGLGTDVEAAGPAWPGTPSITELTELTELAPRLGIAEPAR
ncbi:MAG: hypothetical protein IPG45_37780 [Deltaproteobacteria bacterium]|nr:hypothetical protein [Deltaproteobacteria bacterium]